jgi:hypothetical protein
MKKKNLIISLFTFFGVFVFATSSCDLVNELDPETETEKVTRIFTEGSPWKVDTLNLKEDYFSGGISIVTFDTTYYDYGSIEFLDPAAPENPGFNAGYMIHRYTENGVQKVHSNAWVPYNHNSGSDRAITVFVRNIFTGEFVVGAWDMYLDKIIIEEEELKFAGWRREDSPAGNGGVYGTYRSYSLSH